MKGKSLLLPIVTLLSLASCGKDAAPDRAIIDPTKDSFKVGILQIVGADALEAARKSFKTALDNSPLIKGIKTISYIEYNANGKVADQPNLAKSLVANCDLLLGISTPSASDLKNARDEAGRKQPLLFTAVTDPLDAALVKAYPHQDGSVTGTSDDNPVESQIKLIKRCMPDKDPASIRLGIFYTSSETNSAVQARRARATALEEGINNVIVQTCTDDADIESTCRNLASKIDVLYIPTDNNIADHMNIIKDVVDNAHVLCIVGEENMLNTGGHITFSVSYEYLGRRTGEMAASILSGDKLTENIDVEKSEDEKDWNKVYNSDFIADSNLGFEIPADLLAEFTDVAA